MKIVNNCLDKFQQKIENEISYHCIGTWLYQNNMVIIKIIYPFTSNTMTSIIIVRDESKSILEVKNQEFATNFGLKILNGEFFEEEIKIS